MPREGGRGNCWHWLGNTGTRSERNTESECNGVGSCGNQCGGEASKEDTL